MLLLLLHAHLLQHRLVVGLDEGARLEGFRVCRPEVVALSGERVRVHATDLASLVSL